MAKNGDFWPILGPLPGPPLKSLSSILPVYSPWWSQNEWFWGSQKGVHFDHPGSVPEITVFGTWAISPNKCLLKRGIRGSKGVKKGSKRGPKGVWGPPRPQKWHFLKKRKNGDFWTPLKIHFLKFCTAAKGKMPFWGSKKGSKKGSKNRPNPITPLQGVPGQKPS